MKYYMIKATVSNAQHLEYGQITITFPIPDEEYDDVLARLEAMKLGDAVKRDCRLDELDSHYSILKRLEQTAVNIDELDYLAKRLDSFCVGEDAQFQGMAVKLGVSDMTDFINLTFCCQQATVITDFSDLERIGRDHVLTINGGGMPIDKLNQVDGRLVALDLIGNHDGDITPYGVVYDNGMELEQLYDGRHFPAYLYEQSVMEVAMTHRNEPEDTENITWLFLPMSQTQIERAMLRAGVDTDNEMRLQFSWSDLPDEVDVILDFEQESLGSLNQMCAAIAQLDRSDLPKLASAVSMAEPKNATQIKHLAEQLDLFDFVPGARSAADYGRYMIMESGRFEYDDNLAGYYDFEKYGQERMEREYGEFADRGYISYHGALSLKELTHGSQEERMELSMGGMGGME